MSDRRSPSSSTTSDPASMLHGDILAGYRQVLALIASLTILQAALSALTLVVALQLRASGASNFAMGLVASSYATGLFLGALLSPREIARIGHIRAFVLFAAAAIIVALAYQLAVEVLAWAALQALIGFCFSGLWASGDGWIARAAPAHMRGAVLSFYHVVNKLGAIGGPFILLGIAGVEAGFTLAAALIAAAILPVAATRSPQPETTHADALSLAKLIQIAPAAAWGAFIAGAVNTAVGQLYPVFAATLQPSAPAVLSAQLNAAFLLGAMIALWPAGLLSDRIDRRLVIAAMGVVGAAAAFALALAGDWLSQPVMLAVATIYGAGALSHYAIAVAHAADRTPPEQTTSMMAGILMLWSIGSIVGPILGGAAMSVGLGPRGLFIYAGIGMAGLTAVMMMRARSSEATPTEDKEPFAPTQTTSIYIAELDSRGAGEQMDLFRDIDPPPEDEPNVAPEPQDAETRPEAEPAK